MVAKKHSAAEIIAQRKLRLGKKPTTDALKRELLYVPSAQCRCTDDTEAAREQWLEYKALLKENQKALEEGSASDSSSKEKKASASSESSSTKKKKKKRTRSGRAGIAWPRVKNSSLLSALQDMREAIEREENKIKKQSQSSESDDTPGIVRSEFCSLMRIHVNRVRDLHLHDA